MFALRALDFGSLSCCVAILTFLAWLCVINSCDATYCCVVDEDIEDLANEIAVICAGYRESDEVRALPKHEHERLVGDVEEYANKQKHSIRRLLTSLRESHQVFDGFVISLLMMEKTTTTTMTTTTTTSW